MEGAPKWHSECGPCSLSMPNTEGEGGKWSTDPFGMPQPPPPPPPPPGGGGGGGGGWGKGPFLGFLSLFGTGGGGGNHPFF